MNEPHLFREQYAIWPGSSRKKADYWGFNRQAANKNKITLLEREFKMIETMSRKLFTHPEAKELLEGAQFEITFFSRDQETGVLKKCRVDAIKDFILSDLKTCWDASAAKFKWDARKYGYDLSGAFYLEVCSEFYGKLLNQFYLIPCEKEEPHEITTYLIHPDSIAARERSNKNRTKKDRGRSKRSDRMARLRSWHQILNNLGDKMGISIEREKILARAYEIKKSIDSELIAFGLVNGIGLRQMLALERRLKLICEAAAANTPMPKHSKLYWQTMQKVCNRLDVMGFKIGPNLRIVYPPKKQQELTNGK